MISLTPEIFRHRVIDRVQRTLLNGFNMIYLMNKRILSLVKRRNKEPLIRIGVGTKYLTIISVLAVSLLLPGVVFSQNSWIQLHGTNSARYQYSDRQGTNSEIPSEFWRNDLSLTLTLFDVPISTSAFITDEQSDMRQSMNNIRVYVDFQQLARNLAQREANADPSQSKAESPGSGRKPFIARFASLFSTLEVGKCRPRYGRLALQGIPLSGFNTELNSGIFYAAFATGKIKRAVEATEATDPVYRQDMLLARLGIGKKQETHVYLTYMQAKDDMESLVSRDVADSLFIFPASNTIVGLDVKLNADNKFIIDGEGALSLYTRDLCSPGTDADVPEIIDDNCDYNSSSSANFAFSIEPELKLKTTNISAGVEMIGSGYTTFGNPNLVDDLLEYNAKVQQYFLKRKLTFSTYFKQSKDNLIGWKDVTTTTNAIGVSTGLRFAKAPYLQLSFNPYFQTCSCDSYSIDNGAHIFNAATGYSYPLGSLFLSSNFNYYYQKSINEVDTSSNNSQTSTYTFSQSLSFKFPLSLSGSASWSTNEYLDNSDEILSFNGNITHKSFDKWRNSISVNYSDQFDEQTKLGVSYNTKFELWDHGDIGIRLEKNILDDETDDSRDYDEIIAGVGVTIKW